MPARQDFHAVPAKASSLTRETPSNRQARGQQAYKLTLNQARNTPRRILKINVTFSGLARFLKLVKIN